MRRLLRTLLLAGTLAIPCITAADDLSVRMEPQVAIRLAHGLENNPLGKDASDGRSLFLLWLKDTPGVKVNVCLELIGPLIRTKGRHSDILSIQLVISSAAFVAEHPDEATSDAPVALAGLLGVLTAYEHVLADHPKSRIPFLDDLLRKREGGELLRYVREELEKCGEAQPGE